MDEKMTNINSGLSSRSNSSAASDAIRSIDYNSSGMKTCTTNGTAMTGITAMTTATDILTASLSTPSRNNQIGTLGSTKDCMKLTPVNIGCLVSPIRHELNNLRSIHDSEGRSIMDDTYRENFSLIARQLEKLLDNLNVIFKQIGYSNSEIISKEKMIFNILSDSITKFFYEAESEMKTLTKHNDFDQNILNRILEIIGDNMGTNTISDIYTRNAILVPKNKPYVTSPKKPLSLLSKKKLLQSGKKFVFSAYIPKLVNYLDNCIQFQLLYNAVNANLEEITDDKVFTALPTLELAKNYRHSLGASQNDIDMTTKFIRDNRDELLFGKYFNDISEDMIELITDSIVLYQKEYQKRITKCTAICKNITELFMKLSMDPKKDADSQISELLQKYTDINEPHDQKLIPVHGALIQKLQAIEAEYNQVFETRVESRDQLLSKCQALWYKLKVSDSYVNRFLSEHTSLSLTVLSAFSKELEKLENMKKKLIKTLIDDAWKKIEELWSILQCDSRERADFFRKFDLMKSSSISLEDDEKILDLCEQQIKELEKKMAVYRPVLKLMEEFKQLQADKASLEESSKDSSRLLSRNSHKILLQEEKTRKRITRHFPRIIQELKGGLVKIEEIFGKPLSLNGENLIDMVKKQEDELLNKYPRSRVNLGARRPSTSCVNKPKSKTNISESERRKKNINSTFSSACESISAIDVHQTPAMQLYAVNKQEKNVPSSVGSDTGSIRYMQGIRFSSPVKPLTRLLPPTVIARKSGSRIPEPNVKDLISSVSISSPVFRPRNITTKSEAVRPTRLFPIPSSRINQQQKIKRENFEEFIKNSSMIVNEHNPLETVEKENMINSTPRLSHASEKDHKDLSSPYREPNNSVYKLTMSPEGKCTLNIQENTAASGLDDTSFMDEENDKYYDSWKKAQILKLKDLNV